MRKSRTFYFDIFLFLTETPDVFRQKEKHWKIIFIMVFLF